jgi:hypothetical protein
MFEDLIRGWDGEFVASRFDEPSSTWMFCTHGWSGFGGTRMKVPRAGRPRGCVVAVGHDVQAMAGLPFGGGKSVLVFPRSPTATHGSNC